jgi:hypothetical protein
MAGNSNSGNRTGRRGKPLPIRVRLTRENARRLDDALDSDSKKEMELFVNLILRRYLDEYYPLPSANDTIEE